MLDDEPKGWRDLQERALNERDPKKLMENLDQLNALLTRHERRITAQAQVAEDSDSFQGN